MSERHIEGPGAEFDVGPNSAYDDAIGVVDALSAFRGRKVDDNDDFVYFQTIHLMTEFAWYAMHHEINLAVNCIHVQRFGEATRLIRRATSLQRSANNLVADMRAQLDQVRFLKLRELLPAGGSGLQSPGQRNLRPAANRVWLAYRDVVRETGLSMADVAMWAEPAAGSDAPGPPTDGTVAALHDLAAAMLDLDESAIAWHHVHQRLVWSTLGGHPVTRRPDGATESSNPIPKSLTGRPVDMLDGLSRRVFFPELWHAVNQVYAGTDVKAAQCPMT